MLLEGLDVVTDDSLEVVIEVLHDDEYRHIVLVLAFWIMRIFSCHN